MVMVCSVGTRAIGERERELSNVKTVCVRVRIKVVVEEEVSPKKLGSRSRVT